MSQKLVIAALKAAHRYMKADIEATLANTCPTDSNGKYIMNQMDGPSRPFYEQRLRLFKKLDSALATVK